MSWDEGIGEDNDRVWKRNQRKPMQTDRPAQPEFTALWPVAAVEIYTPCVLEAVNGTDVRLNHTVSCFAPVGDALTDCVVWDGNPERYDISILLWKLWFDDNGTHTCQVKNPPDVDGLIREIQLSIMQTEKKKSSTRGKKKASVSLEYTD
ncbi:hypothetical protein M91_04058 [Bos mutus]|uniref:Ig-like domain-containing protein n=1 Tax=Bos mutus TaxID=72004 RepID=L8IRL4_9CETA|nr:hypothetical protein M91_04058 [Bos mutus]